MKENALYITRKGTRVAGKITDACMGVQLRDVALRPVPNVELHMCQIIAKEREQIFHVRIKIANTKLDLFKRALVTFHSASFIRNLCWNVNQGRNLSYTVEGEGGERGGGDGKYANGVFVVTKRKSNDRMKSW